MRRSWQVQISIYQFVNKYYKKKKNYYYHHQCYYYHYFFHPDFIFYSKNIFSRFLQIIVKFFSHRKEETLLSASYPTGINDIIVLINHSAILSCGLVRVSCLQRLAEWAPTLILLPPSRLGVNSTPSFSFSISLHLNWLTQQRGSLPNIFFTGGKEKT